MAPSTTPTDLTASTADEWQRHLGETVIMHGTFSLFGKTAPYIISPDEIGIGASAAASTQPFDGRTSQGLSV
jgi:hypothetical protein